MNELRICYFGTYREEYSRNKIMIEGLRRNGVEVIECHVGLWRGIDDRVKAASGGWVNLTFLWRVLWAYSKLLFKFLRTKSFDVLVVGYPGQIDVFLAWLLSRLRRKPLVWDVFMSIYLIALERRLDQKSRLTIKLIYWLEKGALFLPDLLIQDTQQYVEWFNRNFGAHEDRFRLIPTGVDDRLFYQRENETGVPPKDIFTILYYGTFISNHGVDVIIEAARLLKDDHNIVFELIGDGPERERCEKKALSEELSHVRFINWLDQDELAMHIQRANLCLGVFGNTPQSLMTVQNKIYECLAMGKPLITGNGPAVDDAFKHCIHLFLCNRTPTSLAEGILTLKGDPKLRESLANTGRDYVVNNFGITKTGQRFREYLSALTYVSR